MNEENLDIRKLIASYLGIVFRGIGYWKWGVALCLLVIIGGTIYALTRRKIFASSTRVRVVSTQVSDTEMMGGEENVGDQLRSRIKAFVTSRRYLQEIIDEHELYHDVKVAKNMTDREVLDYMRTKIETGVWGGDEYTFVFYDHEPDTAKVVAESLAKNFMNREQGSDYAVYHAKLQHVMKQVSELEKQRDDTLATQTRFREVNAEFIKQIERRRLGAPAVDDSSGPTSSSATQYGSNDSPQLRRLRNRLKTLIETENRLRAQSSGGSSVSSPLASKRARINDQLNKARSTHKRLLLQYHKGWPDVRMAKARVQQLESQQRTVEAQWRDEQRSAKQPSSELRAIQSQIRDAEEDVRRLARQEATQQQKAASTEEQAPLRQSTVAEPSQAPLGSLEAVASALKRMEAEFEPLERRVQDLHIQKLKLEFQRDQRKQGQLQHVVVDPADLPTKAAGPNRTKIAGASAAGGLVLGLGLMILLGFLDSRLYRPSDLNRVEHIPMLAAVPDFEREVIEIAAATAPPDEMVEDNQTQPGM